ncbi:MAG: hypothetical protein JRI23_21395 [Deltaproteobacteria bacterium]|jgi:enamine deaminase RidA (YjgF/YER057c/UK114 family)|nr:hypothetical protein [Deltaproteobacteria bacterium]MBW2534497.1 hypothetical protein [Deltaproteobacteria bacterium]
MIHRHRSINCCEEHYLTAVGPSDRTDRAAARHWLDRVAGTLADHRVAPLQERLLGPMDAREELLDLRRQALRSHHLDEDSPCAFVDGRPSGAHGGLGVQLWGVSSGADGSVTVRTVAGAGHGRGRLLSAPDVRLLWLCDVDGRSEDGRLLADTSAQAQRMLTSAVAGLAAHGFTLAQVARTWIFLRRILDWYDEFNRVRTAVFEEHGLTGARGAPPFPASTGIQGSRAGEECTMELLAVAGAGGATSLEVVAESERQNRPFTYGSAFSRAMSLTWHGGETLLVSGTASIGSDGRTRHVDEPEAQAVETLLAIAALLEPRGCRLSDIAAGTVYFKDATARAAFQRVERQLELPRLPLLPMHADVCRPELLIEIEAAALVPTERRTDRATGTEEAP